MLLTSTSLFYFKQKTLILSSPKWPHSCVRKTSDTWNAFSSERSFRGTLNHSKWPRDEWDRSIQSESLRGGKCSLELISHIEKDMGLSCVYIVEHTCGVYLCLMCYAPSPTCANFILIHFVITDIIWNRLDLLTRLINYEE